MNRRQSFFLILAALGLLFGPTAEAARGERVAPRYYPAHSLRQYAYQLRQDTAALVRAARVNYHLYDRRERGAYVRIDRLYRRADYFYRLTLPPVSNPARLGRAYVALKDGDDQARASYPYLPRNTAIDRAISRVDNSMEALADYYEREPAAEPERPPIDLQRVGQGIHRVAEYIYVQATAQSRNNDQLDGQGEVREALERLEDLNASANIFYTQTIKDPSDTERLEQEYRELARAYQRAQDSVRFFSPRVRQQYDRLGRLIDLLRILESEREPAVAPSRSSGPERESYAPRQPESSGESESPRVPKSMHEPEEARPPASSNEAD